MLEASVIICTRDPRPDYLARVLAALGGQTLPPDRWELVIIDNASKVPVAGICDFSSHPAVRHFTESELGIAAARRRGMREALADLLVFVDDDNLLDDTYLSEAVKIKQAWPLLGVWGSGFIKADYEVAPPGHLARYLPLLTLRDAAGPFWSNFVSIPEAIPWGAGLCLRKEVACAYCRFCEQSSIQITGRLGDSLTSGEDREIAHVCCASGFGIGIFPQLKIKHLIPKHRISEDYLIRLAEGIALSDLLISYKWQEKQPRFSNRLGVLLRFLRTLLLRRGLDRRFGLAYVRAFAKARRIIKATPGTTFAR
jgi:glycosyltransferase involved in cell wall biosynthesis